MQPEVSRVDLVQIAEHAITRYAVGSFLAEEGGAHELA
jgi:hypothetical protein